MKSKEEIKYTTKEKSIIKTLEGLEKNWPDNLILFSQSGLLQLRRFRSGQALLKDSIASFSGICSDGGDSD